jgi:HlyD family secretion protein
VNVARPPQKKTVRNVLISVGVLAIAVGVYWLAGLEKVAPTVEMAAMIQDSVKQGDMIREVRGPGTLVRYAFKGEG